MSAHPEDRYLLRGDTYINNPKDLESIVMGLEQAAISLSPRNDSTFTLGELFAEVQRYGDYDEKDIRIILPYCTFLRKAPAGRMSLR